MNQTETMGLFRGLVPMLANRTVIMTVAGSANGCLTVSIIPKKVKDDENDVLTMPLCATGTAEELDRELPRQLREFVEVHASTVSNLDRIKEDLAAAEKAESDARKEKLKGKKVPPVEKPVIPPTPGPQGMLGLFDDAETPEAEVAQ
jgi:PRTRC genetic system protein E